MGALLAVMAAAQQRVIDRLAASGAISADRAVALESIDADEREGCAQLIQGGVVRETSRGLIYLDEVALARGPARMRRLGLFLGGALLFAVVAVIIAAVLKAR